MTSSVRNEAHADYQAKPRTTAGVLATDDDILSRAREILAERLRANVERHDSIKYTHPRIVSEYLAFLLAELEHEEFHVMYLTTQHQLIECVHHVTGTLDQASVYPRELVKAALTHNAGAVILAHNHPGGDPTPGDADKKITRRITEAMELIGVRVLDHIVVGSTGETFSFADHRMM